MSNGRTKVNSEKNSLKWITVALTLPVLVVLAYIVIVNVFNETDLFVGALLFLIGIIIASIAIEVMATFRLGGLKKLVPILASLIIAIEGIIVVSFIIFVSGF